VGDREDAIVARIERQVGVPGLADALASRLAPSDLASLLLAVHRRRAARTTPAQVLSRFAADGFVRPGRAAQRELLEVERSALDTLPDGFEAVILSPVCPLATVASVAPIDQNRVLATSRGTEVVSDPTNVLALEAALRRRADRATDGPEVVRLAAAHRVLRAQRFTAPGSGQHFAQLALCTAGRDAGRHAFELAGLRAVRVAVSPFEDEDRLGAAIRADVIAPLRAAFPEVELLVDADRTRGRGYYAAVALLITAETPAGEPVELADGGGTTWTAQLLGDRKERLLISGIGTERLLRPRAAAHPPPESGPPPSGPHPDEDSPGRR
jgi:hypothetical protein